MKKSLLLILSGILILTLAACASNAAPTPVAQVPAAGASSSGNTSVSFAKDIMPILQNSCVSCHGGEQTKAGLDMTSYDSLMAGSFNGAVVVAGNASQSVLVDLISSGKMPKRGDKLTAEQIQIITDWINAGAPNN